MSDKKGNSRRKFLRNSSIAAIGLSISPLIDLKASPKPVFKNPMCDGTTLDYYGQGPFYSEDAPSINENQLAAENEEGTRLIISGQVTNLDCSLVIPNAEIDIWHANEAGAYDNNGFTLRGKTTSNAQGFYLFETILPGKYLNGNQFRPSHIHFKITPPDFPTLTTQLYFEGDTDIPNDAAASINSGTFDATDRIIPIVLNDAGKYEGTWDIIVDGTGVTGVNDIHLTKGMIYTASPNPFKDSLEIKYGVFENSKINISIFDLNGNQVANLNENAKLKGKHKVTWRPDSNLATGHYFIALKVNDLQVHYLKIIREK